MPALQPFLRLQDGLTALQPVLALVLVLPRLSQVRPRRRLKSHLRREQRLISRGCALLHPGASRRLERVVAALRLRHETAEVAWEEEIVTLSRSSDAYSSKSNGGVPAQVRGVE